MNNRIATPEVGLLAWHNDGFDPREIVEVSPDNSAIRIKLMKWESGWLYASDYFFTA